MTQKWIRLENSSAVNETHVCVLFLMSVAQMLSVFLKNKLSLFPIILLSVQSSENIIGHGMLGFCLTRTFYAFL